MTDPTPIKSAAFDAFKREHDTRKCRACGRLVSWHSLYGLRCCAMKLDDEPEREALEKKVSGAR